MVTRKDDYFLKIFNKFKKKFLDAIKVEMQMGQVSVTNSAKSQGKSTSSNPLTLSKKDIKVNEERMEMFIKDANMDVSKRINEAVLSNIQERGSNKDLASKIKGIFTEDSPNYYNYKNRFRTIAVTESTNILNASGFNKAKKLGAKKKYLSGVSDARQGTDSKVAVSKYGTPEQAIPIDQNFKFTYGKKNYSYLFPPNRPNDREFVLYVFE